MLSVDSLHAVFLLCYAAEKRQMFEFLKGARSFSAFVITRTEYILHTAPGYVLYGYRNICAAVVDQERYQQYYTFPPLQPSSVVILGRLPKEGEKDAVSSSSQRSRLAAVPPTCWSGQQIACARKTGPGADLSPDV